MKDLIRKVAQKLLAENLKLATAESCTGGWVAKVLTDVAGSSEWFERGFVTYSNEAKHEMLGVPKKIIEQHGAVSYETAKAMAEGVLQNSHADVSLAITGVAGPGGGSIEKPVGLVWFAWASAHKPTLVKRYYFAGDRESIRHHAVYFTLEILLEYLK